MKAKITLIIQTIGMYLMHLPLYAALVVINIAMDDRLQGDMIHGLLIASFVMMILMIPICVANAVVSAVSANPHSPSMATDNGILANA